MRGAQSAQQQEQLKSIADTFGVAAGHRPADAPRPSDEEVSARLERYKADLLAVLTPDQLEQWKTMTGTPFKVSKLISGPSWRLVLRASLTISQWNRLQQLFLQNEGLESLQHHEVARELGLSQEQSDRVRKIIDEYRRRFVTDGPPLRVQPAELRTRQQAEQAGLLDVLTPDQKTQWETMQGKKLDLPALLRRGIPPAGK